MTRHHLCNMHAPTKTYEKSMEESCAKGSHDRPACHIHITHIRHTRYTNEYDIPESVYYKLYIFYAK